MEMEVIATRSPFYAFTAHGVPYDTCMQLVVAKSMKVPVQILAYNIVYKALLEKKSITFDECAELLALSGITTPVEIDKVHPFGADILRAHPLRDVDPECVPEDLIKQYLPQGVSVIPKIRERQNLVNKISRTATGYTFKTRIQEFVNTVLDMVNKPIL